ncbi:FAD-dependent oxidoreductase [Agromyces laixinhei]|uniref:FAD-dependent oxidoreductase n=1 Tax=Agromyces laixinhei TaxID=2585717 RepID=UPI0018DB233B|nr:NAD(P)/FAD-dependent oxidoreductase [Agromyces laixinhei]
MVDGMKSAAVVGAGISGLTAAIALANTGLTVRVLEKADAVRTAGSGIAIDPNAQAMLRRVKALDTALDGLPELRQFVGRDGAGRTLGRYDWTSRVIFFVKRPQLLKALYESALARGVEFHLNAEVASVTLDGTVVTTDGRTFRADLVVGADGVRSKVRRALPGRAVLRPLPFRATVTVIDPAEHPDENSYNGEWTEYWSGTKHVYSAPVGGGQTYYAFFSADFKRLPWRRITEERLAAEGLDDHDPAVWRKRFPILGSAIDRVPDTLRSSRFVEVHLRHWSAGRVVVIGDAAHAMAPALGSGGASGMMDAISLADYLHRDLSLASALSEWEADHRPLVDRIQRRSRGWATLFHCGPLVQRIIFAGVNNTAVLRSMRFGHLGRAPIN